MKHFNCFFYDFEMKCLKFSSFHFKFGLVSLNESVQEVVVIRRERERAQTEADALFDPASHLIHYSSLCSSTSPHGCIKHAGGHIWTGHVENALMRSKDALIDFLC